MKLDQVVCYFSKNMVWSCAVKQWRRDVGDASNSGSNLTPNIIRVGIDDNGVILHIDRDPRSLNTPRETQRGVQESADIADCL